MISAERDTFCLKASTIAITRMRSPREYKIRIIDGLLTSFRSTLFTRRHHYSQLKEQLRNGRSLFFDENDRDKFNQCLRMISELPVDALDYGVNVDELNDSSILQHWKGVKDAMTEFSKEQWEAIQELSNAENRDEAQELELKRSKESFLVRTSTWLTISEQLYKIAYSLYQSKLSIRQCEADIVEVAVIRRRFLRWSFEQFESHGFPLTPETGIVDADEVPLPSETENEDEEQDAADAILSGI